MSKSRSVVLISGSPSASSRSALLLERLRGLLRDRGSEAHVVYAADFPADELVCRNVDEESIRLFRARVAEASAVVFATPIYKATYSGLLKLLVDLIPPDGLAGKTVLALATGRFDSHFPLVTQAFDALFAAFTDLEALPTLVIADEQFVSDGQLEERGELALSRAADALSGNRDHVSTVAVNGVRK